MLLGAEEYVEGAITLTLTLALALTLALTLTLTLTLTLALALALALTNLTRYVEDAMVLPPRAPGEPLWEEVATAH